ncbi:uncharacterized protein LOC141720380 isoform X2 [Apium graveolens]|uniref:uncharacterized protein LOC141720380 isoform X2 n=1 Tax=Apium graveolens TaxID=4045 RepID=UPI003D7C136F
MILNLTTNYLFNSTHTSLKSFGFFNSVFPTSNSFSINLNYSFTPPNNRRRLSFSGFIRAVSSRATDYYSVLNLSCTATLPEIKASYRKLARKFHPDMNKGPGAEDKFKEISAAYEVLSDSERRSLYDRYGEAGLRGDYNGADGSSHEVDPFEVFGAFFGDSNGAFGGREESGGMNFNLRYNGRQGLDISHDLFLSFEESIYGAEIETEVSCYERCENCGGTGAKYGSSIKSCTNCGGRGGVVKTQKTPFGIMSQVSTCSRCGGDGNIITDHCKYCGGRGKIQTKRIIKVVIPPGATDGVTMQLRGEGNVDNKRGIVGDLLLVLHINKKKGIRRDGLHLYSDVNVDYTQAILGTVIKVETVDGLRDLQIPSGIQFGDTVKLPHMGVPDINKPSKRGDHHFIVKVQIPKHLSDEERILVEKLASYKASSTECSSSFTENLKSHSGQYEASSSKSNKGSSFWKPIKNFWREKHSGERFASVSVDTSIFSNRLPKISSTNLKEAIQISNKSLEICRSEACSSKNQ